MAEGEGWREERTGMHEREFIETRRHWFTAPVTHHTQGGVNVLNSVEGDEAIVDSQSGAFALSSSTMPRPLLFPPQWASIVFHRRAKAQDSRSPPLKHG